MAAADGHSGIVALPVGKSTVGIRFLGLLHEKSDLKLGHPSILLLSIRKARPELPKPKYAGFQSSKDYRSESRLSIG